MQLKPFVVTIGRSDGSATKHVFQDNRADAVKLANAITFVLFGQHGFKNADCHEKKRVEQDGYFVEFNFAKNYPQHQ
jgi:hypothetical protein